MIKNSILLFNFIILLGCSSNNSLVSNPVSGENKTPGLFSKDSSKGISLNSILNPESSKNSESGANVNAYLWRASLNILSFAPLISTDALGGIIISDWYVSKNNKNQRMKMTAFIKTSELRSNGIGVKVHIQNFKDGSWSETYTSKDLETKIEDNILNEAINLRRNSKK
jgi:ABC-type transport system substrate-binding protein